MFSEYASRFLAQSQSRITARPDDTQRVGRGHLTRPQGHSRFPSSLLNRTTGDPYQPAASHISNFPFASRGAAPPAPLFYSATDEFREEDDETEHEREIADFYALQKSRRHFGGSHMKDSSEVDEDEESSLSLDEQQPLYVDKSLRGKGIRSSWRGGKARYNARTLVVEPVSETAEFEYGSHASRGSSRLRENLVDVGLGDTLRTDEDARGSASSESGDENPPSIQRFREQPDVQSEDTGIGPFFVPAETNKETSQYDRRSIDPPNSRPILTSPIRVESIVHDSFWGQLFLVSLACLFATSFLVYLHTSTPSGDKSKWGDTVYMTVHRSFYLLGIYTVASIFVSLLWLALLRSYVRPLIHVAIFAVPVILYSFSIYPFVSSFKGAWHGASIQDKAMRFGSAVPFIVASVWIYNVIRGRHAIGKAVRILEFACRILAANPELLVLGLGILLLVVSWTWVWMLMLTRVFLGGHISGSRLFIIDFGSWWLGAYFIIVYLWSLGVIAGIQRSVTSATVSQWYFHRLATPTPTSRQIVQAALIHSLTVLFGTICLSRLLSLLIRLPLLLLPRRVTSVLSLFAYSLVPTPVASLTNPLALTYAAIHSKPLAISARGLTQVTNLSLSNATSSLHPRSFSLTHGSPVSLLPYRLSKLILHATRFMMSLALGFGGWVTTARNLSTPSVDGTTGGSMYAYVVGLIAGTIGWSVLGAVEGIVANIVDALVICWSSEVGTYAREARYCREAGWLFGENADSRNTRHHFEA